MCRRPTFRDGNPHRPFCSERCRLHDLGNWASEHYRVPDRASDANIDREDESADEPADPSTRRH